MLELLIGRYAEINKLSFKTQWHWKTNNCTLSYPYSHHSRVIDIRNTQLDKPGVN